MIIIILVYVFGKDLCWVLLVLEVKCFCRVKSVELFFMCKVYMVNYIVCFFVISGGNFCFR